PVLVRVVGRVVVILAVKVPAQVIVGAVGAGLHHGVVQVGALNADPADKVGVALQQAGKLGGVVLGGVALAGGGGVVDQAGKLSHVAFQLPVVQVAFQQHPAADQKDQRKDDDGHGVQNVAAAVLFAAFAAAFFLVFGVM